MASEPALDPEYKAPLKRALGAIGPNVLDLERTLRDAGFRGVDVWNDMIRGFAETPDGTRLCKTLPEIAASTGAFCTAMRWCAEQLERA